MAPSLGLSTVDYIVAAVLLLIPLGIGAIFAVVDRKRVTREEYLMGGRRLSLLPVTLSLFVTFQSAISLIGIPSEVYSYGPMYPTIYFGFSLSYVVCYFIMVPLMHPLHLTSTYQYLCLRYQSEGVRMVSTVIGMVQTISYLAVALLSPALALQAAASIPLWMSIVVVGMIGTLYTVLGGIKSVVWTDTFQTVIVFVGIIAIIVKGCMTVGNFSEVVSLARKGGRLSFDEFSPDPRTRHSWWGMWIGGMAYWLVFLFNQSSVQRVSAMRTCREAKLSFLLNIPCNLVYSATLLLVGIIIYGYFYYIHCDPVEAGIVSNRNQVLPVYVLHALKDLPGMAGLFMATLFSGCLSTLSSGINALAANTVEDILKRPLSSVKEKTATLVTKVAVFFYGILTIGLAYGASYLDGIVTQMAVSVNGACGGPILGLFLIGCLVPWANKYGALTGAAVAIVVNVLIAVGNQLYGQKPEPLPPASTGKCHLMDFGRPGSVLVESFNASTNFTSVANVTASWQLFNSSSTTQIAYVTDTTVSPQEEEGFFLYNISYVWYALFGAVVSVSVGLLVSYFTRCLVHSTPEAKYISPVVRGLWGLTDNTADCRKETLPFVETTPDSCKKSAGKNDCDRILPPTSQNIDL